MKKKLSILFIAFLYLFVSSGVYISMHYCGGKLKSFSFASNSSEDGCCCGTKAKNKNCCKEKALYLMVKDIHKSVDLLKIPLSQEKAIATDLCTLELNYSTVISNVQVCFYHKRPPPISYTQLYITNCTFLI